MTTDQVTVIIDWLCPFASTAAVVLQMLQLCCLPVCLRCTICVASLAGHEAKFCHDSDAHIPCHAVVTKTTVQHAHVVCTNGTSQIQQHAWLVDLGFGPGNSSCSCNPQLEGQREQEAEKAAKKHGEVREAHSRLKRLDKDLKQLTANQVNPGITVTATDLVVRRQHAVPVCAGNASPARLMAMC